MLLWQNLRRMPWAVEGNRQEKLWATTQTVVAARTSGRRNGPSREFAPQRLTGQAEGRDWGGEEGRDMIFTAQLRVKPLPQAAGAQYHSLHDEEAPAAERPAPVEAVGAAARAARAAHGRHCGIGFELVLDIAVRWGNEVDEPLGVSLQKFPRQQQLTVQEVPAVRVRDRDPEGPRVRQRTVEQIVDTIPDSTQKFISLLGGEADLRDWTVPQTAFEAHQSLASEADLPPNKLWTPVAFVLRSRPSMFLAGEALLALQLPLPKL